MSAPDVSLPLAGGHLPPPGFLVFPVLESNPLQSPPSELRALVPRSLLHTLGTGYLFALG